MDLIYEMERSDDLITWRPFLTSQAESGFIGWDHWEMLDAGTATFLRFKISRPFP